MMQKHKDTKWSEVARQAIVEKTRKLELMDTLLAKSTLTEADTLEIGRKVNKSIARQLSK